MKELWFTIFWILGILSVFFIIQLGLNIIPGIPCEYSSEKVTKINNVILSLSYSYAAGLIVFLLVSYIPEQLKKHKTEKSIKPDLELLLNEMYIFFEYLNWKYINSENIDSLTKSDFSKLKKFSNEKMNFRYKKATEINNTIFEDDTEFNYFIIRRKEIINLIVDIFLIPSSIFLDYHLIINLRNLKNCSLFKFVELKNIIDVQNFGNQIHQFYELYTEIKKFSKIDVTEIEIE